MAEDIHNQEEDDLLPEYRFDYTRARPNRFAEGIAEGGLVVVLEPELAQVFKTSEQVKAILRAIADTMPHVEAGTVSG
jgi:hypothetical protein